MSLGHGFRVESRAFRDKRNRSAPPCAGPPPWPRCAPTCRCGCCASTPPARQRGRAGAAAGSWAAAPACGREAEPKPGGRRRARGRRPHSRHGSGQRPPMLCNQAAGTHPGEAAAVGIQYAAGRIHGALQHVLYGILRLQQRLPLQACRVAQAGERRRRHGWVAGLHTQREHEPRAARPAAGGARARGSAGGGWAHPCTRCLRSRQTWRPCACPHAWLGCQGCARLHRGRPPPGPRARCRRRRRSAA